MPSFTVPWGEHLDIARAVATIGAADPQQGAVALAGALHLLQRDLCLQLLDAEQLAQTPEAPAILR